jgi:DNA modification methylase
MAARTSTSSDAGVALERLFDRYASGHRAITVNFRTLAHWMPMGERATHYLHPYPAKLLPQIPAFFLASNHLSSPGSTVLDPFCGSGTVLLESVLSGRHALGADSNPLAQLIARVKVTTLDPERVPSVAKALVRRAASYRRADPPEVVNIAHWFSPRLIDELSRLRRAIETVQNAASKDLLLVCLSACARRVSFADPRISVPVRLRRNQYPLAHPLRRVSNRRLQALKTISAFAEFQALVEASVLRVKALRELRTGDVVARVVSDDARTLHRSLTTGTAAGADLIITSPPYAGAQKYIRASSLSIGWLGLGGSRSLRQLEDASIGREHFPKRALADIPITGLDDADRRIQRVARQNRTRATIAATYLVEMKAALAEAVHCLRPGGHMVLVAGNNAICGIEFRTNSYLVALLEDLGMTTQLRLVDSIRSRGLMTRRNATASVITREWVTVLKKEAGLS